MKEIKVVIISDIHRYYDGIRQVLEQEPHADMYLDLGDNFCGDMPTPIFRTQWTSIKGNNDAPYFPKQRDFTIFDKKIRMLHGDQLFWCYATINEFYDYMKREDVDILLFGHTHQRFADVETDGNGKVVRAIYNPGSIGRPREMDLNMKSQGSYAVLTFYEDGRISHEFKTINIRHS